MKTKREHQIDFEELGDVPTHNQLVKNSSRINFKDDKNGGKNGEYAKMG